MRARVEPILLPNPESKLAWIIREPHRTRNLRPRTRAGRLRKCVRSGISKKTGPGHQVEACPTVGFHQEGTPFFKNHAPSPEIVVGDMVATSLSAEPVMTMSRLG